MFNFDKTDIQRFAVSSVGALVLTAATVVASVSPAKAASPVAPASVEEWQDRVHGLISTAHEPDSAYQPEKIAVSEVAVRFTADGDFAGAQLGRSSGDSQLDARAVRVASRLHYPALPESFRGAPTTVRMTLYFGDGADIVEAHDAKKAKQNIQLAAL